MKDSKGTNNKSMLEAACKAGWNAAEGATEYTYYPTDERFGEGMVRIPLSGSWMYVRCPILEYTDGYVERSTGEYAYWRHGRFVPDWKDPEFLHSGGRRRAYYSVGGAGAIYAEEFDYDPDFYADIETQTKNCSVQDCRRALQKHHPDRGGDARVFRIWKARFDEAKKQRTVE